nr:Hero-cluster NLR-B [synthetic construct]
MVCLTLEEERRRISDLIDDLLNGLKKIKKEFIASKWDDIEKLRMELRFLRTFVLFRNWNLDDFYDKILLNIEKLKDLTDTIFNEDEFIVAKYNMDSLPSYLRKEINSYLRLKNVAKIITEENMFEYTDSLLKNLHDLPKYCSDLLLPLMSEYNILRQVCTHLRDFYQLKCNKTTKEFLYAWYRMTVDRVTQFCFDLWTGKYKNYGYEYAFSECSSKITSLLIDIIPLELEVLHISTSKLIKESTSKELEGLVKQILKASPRILQNNLIHLQRRMEVAVDVNYAPTRSISVMMEFLLIFLTDMPKRFIHREKLNDMLAHAGMLTRKISFLVIKLLEEISEDNINEADFSAPDFLQEIEQMKGDIRHIFLKAPESSQLRFPMDDGFLFMNLLLRHLNDLLIANVSSVTLIKKEIRMVKESLEFLTSSFGKVRKTLDGNSGVVKDCWLHALDVAYEAEHIINSILVRDKTLLHLVFSLPNVTDKIKLIVAQVTSLQLEDKNGDEPLDAKSSHESIVLTSSPFVEVTVGHEEEEAWIIGQLLDEHESELDVISIVGMPGVGKTTLANKVYNNTLVASHFHVHAKCTVSQKYNKSKVLQEILQQVTGSGGKESEDDLAEMLRVALYNKRYLIVLDDVWDIATGEMLMACFPKVKRGNRIILTSRSSKVGLQVKCHSDPLRLQLLTPEKSWDLFVKKVFGDEGSCPAELSEVGHQIVEKCKGLPLAIVLIAGVIVRGKKKEKDFWLKILHNLDSFISTNISLVMQLSYDHLPCHLKPLLLYFATTQKSQRTPVSTLMQLWMAEGFVDHDSLEEVTQSYLDALISSNLIMVDHIPSESIWWTSTMIKVCYMHDVVHDFVSVKAEKEKFFKLINSGDHASDLLHHRLTIYTDYEGELCNKCVLCKFIKCSAVSKYLLSLRVRSSVYKYRYIHHTRQLRLLKVLQLDDFIVFEDSLMKEIGSLFHLRFLSIKTDMKAIPESWVNLQNLETLLINPGFSPFVLLPRILKLSKLKYASVCLSSFFDEEEEDNIRLLEGENSKLKTLSKVDISYSQGTNDALEKFPNLEHLDCTIIVPKCPPKHGDWFPRFDVLNKLQSLSLNYHKPRYYFCNPIEYHFPTGLKELRLFDIPMRPALLSAIVALPQLEILEINYCNFVMDKWDASEDIYQSLKTLRLACPELSEWEVDRETFPKLEELIVENCFMLMEIPYAFGDIDTLKSIRLVQNELELRDSAMKIKKDVIDFTGEDRLHVHISSMYLP